MRNISAWAIRHPVPPVVLFIVLFFLGAVGLFEYQNQQAITVRFADRGVTAPVALLALAAYLLGMLSGWTVVGLVRRSLRRVTEEPRRD